MSVIVLTPEQLREQLNEIVNDAVTKALAEVRGVSTKKAEIISRDELCKRLDITEPTVIRWEKKGKIPAIRIGSNVRYDWNKVLEALEEHKDRK